ncbi:hypothetical protein OIU84_021237 [Salix udensis]|uniref:Uncharacterized protein n=1 Tax=Salix udensis TaxID=889485 RepID=A0AAD6PH95_9ROSI|nr:hypothetical protein OIU84_021237 [Salix udensis]
MLGARKRVCNPGEEESGLRRGPWTLEEDTSLTHYISRQGEGRWNMLAKGSGLKRTGKKQLLILELHSKWGNRWSKIAAHLPGRTDNEIKNYWRTKVQKEARHLNIEANSKRFLDAVRSYWMPRLVQKMEQASYSSSSTILDSLANREVRSTPSNPPVPNSLLCPPESRFTHYSNLGSDNISCSVTSPYLPSANSNTISQQPDQILETPSCSPLLGDSVCNSLVRMGTCNEEGSSCDMDGFDVASAGMGTYGNSPFECQMAGGDWVFDSMEDTLWNMDDMWPFRA